jgi:hypothetical protein
MKKLLVCLASSLLFSCDSATSYSEESLSFSEQISGSISSESLSSSSESLLSSKEELSSSSETLYSSFCDPTRNCPPVIRYEDGYMADERDGNIYRTVTFPDLKQIWMAENLNYATDSSSTGLSSDEFCSLNNDSSCTFPGRIYTLTDTTELCPRSWHVPSWTEWKRLLSYAFQDHNPLAKELENPYTPYNDFIFGLPCEEESIFYNLCFWSALDNDTTLYAVEVCFFTSATSTTTKEKKERHRIRCVQNYSEEK